MPAVPVDEFSGCRRIRHGRYRASGEACGSPRNGERRPDKDAHDGVDVISAIWVTSICDENLTLHNGRHYWILSRTKQKHDDDAEICHYDIVDDDGDPAKGRIWLAERKGYRVPVRIELRDGLKSTLKLVDISEAAPADERAVTRPVASKANVASTD